MAASPAVADNKIYVTDPLKSKIIVLDATSFKKTSEISVEGQPFNIVAVGGSGKVHGEHHDHEAHHHDDHAH
ncbi:TPA: hypothetical protein ACPXOO_004998 [Klebsiella pneumoniae]|uniref:hypothetical protein n=1 Tax=Klebsiella pneumoniae TaxID=573 RepID=UPI0024BB91E8|nr:hypothetical protein [Klebsiella pneumoniae]WHR14550.1 hypothetical protein MO417_09535 [Klebsiella pneumoniae]